MKKRVLVLWYSQSGQLQSVIETIQGALTDAGGIALSSHALAPVSPFPYPWSFWRFLDAFPETATLTPAPIQPLPIPADARFDLVILGYPVWYLSPPPPLTAFLQSAQGQGLLADTPVVTVTACRNMWLMAQEDVKALLCAAKARLVGHIALIDQGSTLATFITTPRWLLTGRKNAFWGLPAAGVAPEDIAASRRFGEAIAAALAKDAPLDATLLQGLGACRVDERLIASERIGKRSFRLWGRLLCRLGPPGGRIRQIGLAVYVCFLLLMILSVVPVTMLLKAALRPLLDKKLQRLKADFEQPSGSAVFRLTTPS